MKNLYVGNLPHSTTESELRSVFEAHGAVEKGSIVTDRETGRARGVAFVERTKAAAETPGKSGAQGQAQAGEAGRQRGQRGRDARIARARRSAGSFVQRRVRRAEHGRAIDPERQ